MIKATLSDYLTDISAHKYSDTATAPIGAALQQTITSLAEAASQIAQLAAHNGIASPSLGALAGGQNDDGDSQKQLDMIADDIITKALAGSQVGVYFSEEQTAPQTIHNLTDNPTDDFRMLGLACDPLDGSSNIDTNTTIGTIFSLFHASDIADNLPPKGRRQLAAGLFVYGPQTSLLLSFGDEVVGFGRASDGVYYRLDWQIAIPPTSPEFAINASNAAFWPPAIQDYIHELSYGAGASASGMRWLGSLVADAYRIFRRGGLFLYPQDSRKGYEAGRLRLVYEANPIAFLIEAAGGVATTGTAPILDQPPTSLHQRVPLIFGSHDEVTQIIHNIKHHKGDPSS